SPFGRGSRSPMTAPLRASPTHPRLSASSAVIPGRDGSFLPSRSSLMKRGVFLHTTGAALGGLTALGPAACRAAPPSAMVPCRLGAQLYTARDVFADDFVGVLETIKR